MSQECPQCGFMHPPLRVGESCPIAKQKDSSGKEIDYEFLFTPLRNILKSQFETKGIKDHNKLFGSVIVEITKHLETYKE